MLFPYLNILRCEMKCIVEREEKEEEVEEEDGGRTKGFEWRHAVKRKYFRVR